MKRHKRFLLQQEELRQRKATLVRMRFAGASELAIRVWRESSIPTSELLSLAEAYEQRAARKTQK